MASDESGGHSDGGQATYSASVGSGKSLGLTLSYEGLKAGVYGAERDRTVPQTAASSGNYEQMSSTVHGMLNIQ